MALVAPDLSLHYSDCRKQLSCQCTHFVQWLAVANRERKRRSRSHNRNESISTSDPVKPMAENRKCGQIGGIGRRFNLDENDGESRPISCHERIKLGVASWRGGLRGWDIRNFVCHLLIPFAERQSRVNATAVANPIQILILDDDLDSVALQQRALRMWLPDAVVESRNTPNTEGTWDLCVFDDDFHNRKCACEIAIKLRMAQPSCLQMALSGCFSDVNRSALTALGCEWVCDKSDAQQVQDALQGAVKVLKERLTEAN